MTPRIPDNFWSSLALFLLPALSLALPSGYSYAPALLLMVSLVCVCLWWGKWSLPKEAWWMYGSFALLALSWLIDNWISGERGSALEKPLKMLVTLPCLWYLAQRPPSARWLWHGVVVGAIASLGLAIWQILTNHPSWVNDHRTTGFTNAIQFGNLALLLGLLSLCGWNAANSRRTLWRIWLIVGFAAGMIASMLSGSRGGWLALTLLAGLACLYLLATHNWRTFTVIVVLGTSAAFSVLQVPQLHLKERIAQARHEVNAFCEEGNAFTSVGARLQMWHFAWKLIREKPVLGWSQRGYMEQTRLAINSKQLHPIFAQFNHPHNEILDTTSKRGIVGLFILLFAYITPLLLFLRTYHFSLDKQARSICVAGIIIPVMYFGFGLTQSFLSHNSGMMMYVYMLAMLWGSVSASASSPKMAT